MSIKDILLSLTYMVGAGELALAIFFWVTHSKNEIRKVVALFALSTGLWAILSGITTYVPYSNIGYYEMAGVYVLALIFLTALVQLVIIMPYPLFRVDWLHKALGYFPIAIFGYILFFSTTIVESFQGSSTNSGTIIGGPLFNLYNVYSLMLYVSAIIIGIYRAKRLDGMHRQNMKIFVWSIFLGGAPGAFLFLILPIISPTTFINSLLGVIPSVFWIGGTTYILLKK